MITPRALSTTTFHPNVQIVVSPDICSILLITLPKVSIRAVVPYNKILFVS
ncbi:6485_t:CDS:2 [Entrophospora sp. SA101]|nr:6485_t:CDS:2 [Entrophospora sp. SA101]